MSSPDNVLPLARGPRDQEHDQVPTADRSGPAIMNLLQQAADVARRNEERAKAMAQRLAEELKVAERRIQELEEHARHCQERAEQAEQWLMHIGDEIQSKLIGARAAAAPASERTRR